jgi:hypothetical protein
MTVEDDLQGFARRAVVLANEAKTATDNETRRLCQDKRNVMLMEAEQLIARNPGALKAKAMIVWDDDWVQNPTSAEASFIRSLLRDLLQWEA